VTTERVAYFMREWNTAILRYEQADREFQRITAEYLAQVDAGRPARAITARRHHEGLTVVEATHLARQDPYRKDAASARQHFADRAMMYGISALVEVLCRDEAGPA
jgi:hypothetical protein